MQSWQAMGRSCKSGYTPNQFYRSSIFKGMSNSCHVSIIMDAGNDFAKVALQNHNTNNFYIFSSKMEVVLRERGLCNCVRGSDGVPAGQSDTLYYHQKYNMSLILLRICDERIAPVNGLPQKSGQRHSTSTTRYRGRVSKRI